LEITAFLASLSKVCSMFETGLIPPNVNLSTPNPAIRWKEYNMRVPTDVLKLSRRSGNSLIAMTSSGIGGSNGHVVLEAPPQQARPLGRSEARPLLLIAGGLSPQTASAVAVAVALAASGVFEDLSSLSTIYGRRSRQLTWRTFATWVPGEETIEFPPPTLSARIKAPIVFVFSGQGPQHFNS
jgi:acyl transferase domain-containing protein